LPSSPSLKNTKHICQTNTSSASANPLGKMPSLQVRAIQSTAHQNLYTYRRQTITPIALSEPTNGKIECYLSAYQLPALTVPETFHIAPHSPDTQTPKTGLAVHNSYRASLSSAADSALPSSLYSRRMTLKYPLLKLAE